MSDERTAAPLPVHATVAYDVHDVWHGGPGSTLTFAGFSPTRCWHGTLDGTMPTFADQAIVVAAHVASCLASVPSDRALVCVFEANLGAEAYHWRRAMAEAFPDDPRVHFFHEGTKPGLQVTFAKLACAGMRGIGVLPDTLCAAAGKVQTEQVRLCAHEHALLAAAYAWYCLEASV